MLASQTGVVGSAGNGTAWTAGAGLGLTYDQERSIVIFPRHSIRSLPCFSVHSVVKFVPAGTSRANHGVTWWSLSCLSVEHTTRILRWMSFVLDPEYWEDYSDIAGNVRHTGAGSGERAFDGRDYPDKTLRQESILSGACNEKSVLVYLSMVAQASSSSR
jgi:hypothetical protein